MAVHFSGPVTMFYGFAWNLRSPNIFVYWNWCKLSSFYRHFLTFSLVLEHFHYHAEIFTINKSLLYLSVIHHKCNSQRVNCNSLWYTMYIPHYEILDYVNHCISAFRSFNKLLIILFINIRFFYLPVSLPCL